MTQAIERTIGIIREKLELLTGERANGARRAVLISELEAALRVGAETANRLDTKVKASVDEELAALETEITLAINQARAEFDTAIDEVSATVAENSAASEQMFADINHSIDDALALIDTANAAIADNAAAADQAFEEVEATIDDAKSLIRANSAALQAAIQGVNDERELGPVIERVVTHQEIKAESRAAANVTASFEEFRVVQVTTNSAIAGQLVTIAASVDDASARITSEQTARATADGALSTRIDNIAAIAGGGTAAVDQEAIARIAGDQALAAQITTLTATVTTNDTSVRALVQNEATARATGDTALAGQITSLTSTVNTNTAAIQSEAATRATTDTALAAQINVLTALVQGGETTSSGQISALQTVVTNLESSAVSRTDAAVSAYSNATDRNEVSDFLEAVRRGVSVKDAERKSAIAAAGVQSNTAAITNTNEALASLDTTVFARFATTDATIQQQAVTFANADLALSSRIATLESSVTSPTGTGILARLATEEVTRAQADFALSGRVTTLESSVTVPGQPGGILARLITEEGTRATADSALSSRVTTLESSVTNPNQSGGILARIVSEETARATADTALSTRVSSVEASVNNTTGTGVRARLLTEEATRASADTALSGRISTVEASVTNTTGSGVLARLVTEEATRASADTALSGRVTTIESSVTNPNQSGGLLARIITEELARAAADNTIAANVNTLTTTVNGNTTSIETLTASYNGIAAKYGVTINADGYVSGFSLLSGSGASEFNVQADKFRIAFPGATPRQVMSVQSINGTPTLTFDGNIIATGTVGTSSIGARAVTDAVFSRGSRISGWASVVVPAGSIAIITAIYEGGDEFFDRDCRFLVEIPNHGTWSSRVPKGAYGNSTVMYGVSVGSRTIYCSTDQTISAQSYLNQTNFIGGCSVQITVVKR